MRLQAKDSKDKGQKDKTLEYFIKLVSSDPSFQTERRISSPNV